jgi:serine-type D-Ala-D-Ala carboxypeptidase/endopeptidase (penicillin-binding protein 4)
MNNVLERCKLVYWLAVFGSLYSCSVNKQIAKQAKLLLADSAVATGHTGISIYDPATGKYLYNHNATQYFIPASNTKLFSLYAGMKYLGDSLVAATYHYVGNNLFVIPSGDPTFLHPNFKYQPLYELIKAHDGIINTIGVSHSFNKFGKGWMYNDIPSTDMPERSRFPIFGNILTMSKRDAKLNNYNATFSSIVKFKDVETSVTPKFFAKNIKYNSGNTSVELSRKFDENLFEIDSVKNGEVLGNHEIPFATRYGVTAAEILSDLLGKKVENAGTYNSVANQKIIHSQPSDSLFKPMMHRSDNFFAEQTLLMASNELLGYMSDDKMIDTILKSSLKDIPQKPKWVDGSGLSRYNLFTPQSIIYLLNKMKTDFGLERLKVILPTGGEGTLSNYYRTIPGFIYAKTGTLSNNCALSGYLITQKGKLLMFSILNNNYITGATPVRRATERFLQYIQQKL